jgi:hypothetical protein
MIRKLLLLACLLGVSVAGRAQSYGLYQTCQLQTATGNAIAGAQVYFLTQPANTTTLTPLAPVYSSSTGGAVTQPLTTNGFGMCTAYLAPGIYTVCYVSQYTGQLCYPDQNVSIGGGGGGGSGTTVNPVTQMQWTTASGPALPTNLCPTATTGNLTNGSPTVIVTSTANLYVGQQVVGTGIPSSTYILSINTGATSVTLTQNATTTQTGVSLSFYSVGQPFQDTTNNQEYFCTLGGWYGNVQLNPAASQTVTQPAGTYTDFNALQAFGTNPFVGFAATAGGTSTAGITASNGVFDFGNGTVGSTMGSVFAAIANGTYYPLNYAGGDLCAQMSAAIAAMPAPGGTLDVRGLSSVSPATCSSNPFAGVTKPLSVLLGPGKINTTAQWYINSSFLHLQGAGIGNTQLIYTGTTALKDPGGVNPGGVLELDSATPSTSYNYGDSVSDMAIVGNANSPYAMLVDGTHHSMFRNLSLWGSATCDYESKFAVVDDLDNIHSSNGDASFFGFPGAASPNGMCLDGESSSYSTTAATVTNPLIEGHATCGIELSNAGQMVFTAGTSEANGTSGVTTSANLCLSTASAFHNAFFGLDMEAAGNVDILDNGRDNIFQNDLGATKSIFAGVNAQVLGGQIEAPTVSSTAIDTYFDAVRSASNVADSGTGTYGTQFIEGINQLNALERTLPNTVVNPNVATQVGEGPGGLFIEPTGPLALPTQLENTGDALLGWNYSGGLGENDLFSNRQAGSAGGFSFYDMGNTGTVTHLLDLFPTQATFKVPATFGSLITADNGVTVTGGTPGIKTPALIGTAPVTYVADAGAGSGATTPVCATGVNCTALSGTITLTTGTSPAAGLGFVTVTFTNPLPYVPTCQVRGMLAAAAATQPFVSSTATSSFVFEVATAPAASTALTYTYICVN